MWCGYKDLKGGKSKENSKVEAEGEFSSGHGNFEMPLRLSRGELAVNTFGEVLVESY